MRALGDDTSMNPALLNAAMDATIDELRSAVSSVRTKVAAERAVDRLSALLGILGPWIQMTTSTDDAKAATLSAMLTIDNIIARLDGPSRAEVLAGTLDPGRWYAAAKEVSIGVVDLLKMYDSETRVNYFNERMDAVAAEFKRMGAKIGAGPFGWDIPLWVWLVGGGVGLLFLLNNFVPLISLVTPPRRQLRGYNPKRKAKRRTKRKHRGYGWKDPETRDLEGYGWDDPETEELS